MVGYPFLDIGSPDSASPTRFHIANNLVQSQSRRINQAKRLATMPMRRDCSEVRLLCRGMTLRGPMSWLMRRSLSLGVGLRRSVM